MQFVSYQSTSSMTSPVNSGSYLSDADDTLLNFSSDNSNIWYGTSNFDIVELGIWDLDQTLIGWGVITGSINVTSSNSYLNSLNSPSGFSTVMPNNGFIIYNNSDILINPINDLNVIGYYNTGSYFLTYNMVRNIVGDQNAPLVIKEISPSRTEIKLLPQGDITQQFTSYCSNQVLISDIYQVYINQLVSFPANSIYNNMKLNYTSSIAVMQNVLSLKTESDVINYIINMYEDVYSYSSINNYGNTTRTQGIKSYFFNYMMDNLESSITFGDLDSAFTQFVNSVIDSKISRISDNMGNVYYNSIKTFIYDFIVAYYYQNITDNLSDSYNNIYNSPLKNGLNFGQNQLYTILNTGAFNEADGSVSLIIKLKETLPSNISVGDTCWISNISLSPIVLNVSINETNIIQTYVIRGPDFSLKDKNALTPAANTKYSINDINPSITDNRNISISKKIKELTIDYTDFTKFIIFSSAEVRLKIFKNKKIQLDTLNSTIDLLNVKNQDYITLNNTAYPFYINELATLNCKLDSIVDSFDGYESYLFDSGIYDTLNGNFINVSAIQDLESSASEYDIQNRDSLIKNTPKYILEDTNNDDYIIFLSMIGHFFDNIYIYISNLPSAKMIGNSVDKMLSNKMVSAILEEMGWDITDILSEDNILNYNLTNSNSAISSDDRIKIIENRILKNLPLIYKTKGTQQSVDLLLACYGIPQSLLNIKEYGGYNHSSTGSCDFYERAYLYTWDNSAPHDMFTLDGINGAASYMFKVRFNNPNYYSKGDDNILFGAINQSGSGYPTSSSISGSGDWAVGFTRTDSSNSGTLYFRLGYKGQETFKLESPEFSLFDGNIYSVLIRKNGIDPNFDIPNFTGSLNNLPRQYDLVVKRNNSGDELLNISASYVNYYTPPPTLTALFTYPPIMLVCQYVYDSVSPVTSPFYGQDAFYILNTTYDPITISNITITGGASLSVAGGFPFTLSTYYSQKSVRFTGLSFGQPGTISIYAVGYSLPFILNFTA